MDVLKPCYSGFLYLQKLSTILKNPLFESEVSIHECVIGWIVGDKCLVQTKSYHNFRTQILVEFNIVSNFKLGTVLIEVKWNY